MFVISPIKVCPKNSPNVFTLQLVQVISIKFITTERTFLIYNLISQIHMRKYA